MATTLVGQQGKYLHLSAPKRTTLKELEHYAQDLTGAIYEAMPGGCNCIPDSDDPDNYLIWTLERRG